MPASPATRIDHFAALRTAVATSPLPALDAATYARDHAEFEERSDQRELIADWMVERLVPRARPLSVLAVGAGDGQLDAQVAERLLDAEPGAPLTYSGIEPFLGSAQQFTERMSLLEHLGLVSDTIVDEFAHARVDERFDVVTFVHSMYYVPDVAEAATTAAQLLRPDGELLVLSAPRAELNRLASMLAPPIEGHRQWFSDDVSAGLAGTELLLVEQGSIDATVDLTDADDDVLDFTVQARLTPAIRALVRAYLADVSLIEGRSVIPHPVDTFVLQPA